MKSVQFADPTLDTLSLISSDKPEKSALSVNALVIPISSSVFFREASAEMENFGRNRSKDLRNTVPDHCNEQLNVYSSSSSFNTAAMLTCSLQRRGLLVVFTNVLITPAFTYYSM